jgi:hypothetical protein
MSTSIVLHRWFKLAWPSDKVHHKTRRQVCLCGVHLPTCQDLRIAEDRL